MTENALIIFIKNPIKGKVKTRLAHTMGDDKALAIYLQLSEMTREVVQLLRGADIYVFYSDFIDINDEWHGVNFKKCIQIGDDLGIRMQNAFDLVFQNHYHHVCIIGSDCPTLSTDILQQAFEQLATNDFVVGPSTDGGYYLLGISMNAKNEASTPQYLFEKMAWSTNQVLPKTLERIKEKCKTYHLLPELTDIDEEGDWLNFQKTKLRTN